MADLSKWIRKDLQDFEPYHVMDIPHKYKLDANESPFQMPEVLIGSLVEWLQNDENLNRYPDTDSLQLRKALAEFWNVSIENIVCGVGSDQLIDYITKAFLEHGEVIATLEPTFSMYTQSAVINRGGILEIKRDEKFNLEVSAIVQKIKEAGNVKLLFICTPNNPTGNEMNQQDILEVARQLDIPVIVDEAYGEFTDRSKSAIHFVKEFDNLIVLKTFSKAFGLAGARVGYAIADKALINAIDVVRAPYNLPTISQFLATQSLKNFNTYQDRIDYLKEQREAIMETLAKMENITIYPSHANFIYVESKNDMSEVFVNKKILIRKFAKTESGYTYRISIGTQEENEAVLEALRGENE